MKSGFSLLLVTILSVGCSSLNTAQKSELKEWEASNLGVQEKSPGTAAALNVLPGIGDFYNGNVGLGVVNLLAWPLSILWAPVGGASGADEVNYYVTKSRIDRLETNKKKLKSDIETAFIGKEISKEQFVLANRKVENMSLKDFENELSFRDIIPKNMEELESERTPSSLK